MSDRHLCRAKRTDNGEWVIGNRIDSPDGRIAITETSGDWELHEVDPSTICQCTGLTDKNGKLIWEKDIVKHDMSDIVGTVKWYKEDYVGWCVDDIQINEQQFTDEMWDECEVIGNIFENPELLEVQNELL